ncbi:hypothetical protein B0T20DRAFT_328030, partial [Sordaria brevicollis]
KGFRSLKMFQATWLDTVVVGIDLEGIDHRNNGLENWEKISEVGVSYFDYRDFPPRSASTPRAERLSNLTKLITSHHIIIKRWRNFDEVTCPARYHQSTGKSHTAMPYHCMVAESQFRTHEEAISDIDRILRELSTRNLTDEEREAGKTRTVLVLYWDARMESTWFHDMGFNVRAYGAIEWDFQKWKPFRSRNGKAKTGGAEAFTSLGVCLKPAADGKGALHNATNDTFAQVVAFLRFMAMTEEEWTTWRGRIYHGQFPDSLEQVDLKWITKLHWEKNQELRPVLPAGKIPEEVEDIEDIEDAEDAGPVVVRHSIQDDINRGLTAIDADVAPKEHSWAAIVCKRPGNEPKTTSAWSPSASWSPSTTWPPNTCASSSLESPAWGWNSTTTLASANDYQEPPAE